MGTRPQLLPEAASGDFPVDTPFELEARAVLICNIYLLYC
jgi:hypothetical protein